MQTVSVFVDGLSIEYTVEYPLVSVKVSFRVPDAVPIVGGKFYSLPVNFFVGNSETFLGRHPPAALYDR